MSSQLPVLKGIYVLSGERLTPLDKNQVSPATVGAKAYGLLMIPSVWVPDFFVIDIEDPKELETEVFQKNFVECINKVGIDCDSELLLRSSGVSENLSERGSLKSFSCTFKSLKEVLAEVFLEVSEMASGSKVFWIVQKKIKNSLKGHLSNERRLTKAKRDWILEVESTKYRNGTHNSIAVRNWRDDLSHSPNPLICDNAISLSKALKEVSIWAYPPRLRIHFEWVWDGGEIYLVQADLSQPNLEGKNPRDLVVSQSKSEKIGSLNCFMKANEDDFKLYTKLRNVDIYQDIGYKMPSFYILKDSEYIEHLIKGKVLPEELVEDLTELTKFPLVIRTDTKNTLKGEKRMLPRSDELRSIEDAIDWFNGPFKEKIKIVDHREGEVVLIAHHYMPAVASAWCRASPNDRQVRIESLWGLPDGLHWYSHDVHEVDTRETKFPYSKLSLFPGKKVGINKRIRFKGRFIAPNSEGEWIVHETRKPFDWSDCIKSDKWLQEISHTSRAIATKENSTVAVMWFIDVQESSSSHNILPWYHEVEVEAKDGTSQITPRHKRQFEVDFIIKTTEDWELLKKEVSSATKSIKRVCVIPEDPKIFRDQNFSNELSKISKENDIVIELSGGILSHAYYMLTSAGVNVECIDLYGTSKQQLEFNKLVRDKIPEQIYSEGESVKHVVLKGEAFQSALKIKLVEEVFEVFDSSSHEEIVAEMADVLEVISALENIYDIELKSIGSLVDVKEGIEPKPSNYFLERRSNVEKSEGKRNQIIEIKSIIPLYEPYKGQFYMVFPKSLYRFDYKLTRKSLSLFLKMKISLVQNTDYLFVDVERGDDKDINKKEFLNTQSETDSEKLLLSLKSEMLTKAFDAHDSKDIETLKLNLEELLGILLKVESLLKLSHSEVEQAKDKKKQKKGGFEEGLVLVETTKYQSLRASKVLPLISENIDSLNELDVPKSLYSFLPLDLNTLGCNIDLIHISDQEQRLIKIDSTIPLLSSKSVILPSLSFSSNPDKSELYSIALELNRDKACLSYKLKAETIPSQIEFKL